jgi:hypothetical protein
MTSYCNVLYYFHFSYRRPWSGWLVMPLWSLSPQMQTHQLLLPYASLNEISRTGQSGHMIPLIHAGSLLNTYQSTGHECIPTHSRWRNSWQDSNSCLTPKSTLVKSCQLFLPTAPLYIVPTWVKLPSSLVQPYNINTIHDDLPSMINWPQLNTWSICHFRSICKIHEHVWRLLPLPIPNNKFQTLKYYQVATIFPAIQLAVYCPNSICEATIPARISCMELLMD